MSERTDGHGHQHGEPHGHSHGPGDGREHDHDAGHLGHMQGPFSDEDAAWYIEEHGEDPSHRLLATALLETGVLHHGQRVLDIGCGSGGALRQALSLMSTTNDSLRAFGVDPTPMMIEVGRQRAVDAGLGDRLRLEVAGAEALPHDDASLELAWTQNTLHHWEDLETGLGEVHRVLVPGGRFIVAESDADGSGHGHGHGPLSDPEHLVDVLSDAGFRSVTLTRHTEADEALFLISGHTPPRPVDSTTEARPALSDGT